MLVVAEVRVRRPRHKGGEAGLRSDDVASELLQGFFEDLAQLDRLVEQLDLIRVSLLAGGSIRRPRAAPPSHFGIERLQQDAQAEGCRLTLAVVINLVEPREAAKFTFSAELCGSRFEQQQLDRGGT